MRCASSNYGSLSEGGTGLTMGKGQHVQRNASKIGLQRNALEWKVCPYP